MNKEIVQNNENIAIKEIECDATNKWCETSKGKNLKVDMKKILPKEIFVMLSRE